MNGPRVSRAEAAARVRPGFARRDWLISRRFRHGLRRIGAGRSLSSWGNCGIQSRDRLKRELPNERMLSFELDESSGSSRRSIRGTSQSWLPTADSCRYEIRGMGLEESGKEIRA